MIMECQGHRNPNRLYFCAKQLLSLGMNKQGVQIYMGPNPAELCRVLKYFKVVSCICLSIGDSRRYGLQF